MEIGALARILAGARRADPVDIAAARVLALITGSDWWRRPSRVATTALSCS
jgi:hypothetical protein